MMHFLDGRALAMMFFLVAAAATAGATTENCGRSVTNRMGPMRAGSYARARDHASERARERASERASQRVSQIFTERESGEREPAASKNALEANGEQKIGAAQNNSVLDATDLPAIVTQVAGIPFWMPSTSSHHANLCEPPAALHADTATISRTTKRGAATSTHEQQAFSIWQALWSPHYISRDTLSCQAAAEGTGAGGVGGDGAARWAAFTDAVLAPMDLMPLGALTRARVFCALVAASRFLHLPSSLLRLKHITALPGLSLD